jgi:hypothetical protein
VTRRVQGGTAGLLSAIDAGRIDELDARIPDEPPGYSRMTPTRVAEIKRRDAHRAHLREKQRAKRSPF